jgi:hypothetical protein
MVLLIRIKRSAYREFLEAPDDNTFLDEGLLCVV